MGFFFKNGIFFENCADCTDFLKKCTDWFKKMYGLYGFLKKNCTDCFSKIVRIVRISSENVRIFVRMGSKKFWPPCNLNPKARAVNKAQNNSLDPSRIFLNFLNRRL